VPREEKSVNLDCLIPSKQRSELSNGGHKDELIVVWKRAFASDLATFEGCISDVFFVQVGEHKYIILPYDANFYISPR